MVESNCQFLDINFIAPVGQAFIESPWYVHIVYILLNLQAPSKLSRTKSRFLKMKSLKFCILDNALFWRDHEGILLNCLLNEEFDKILEEFHASHCGGHPY